MKQEVLVTGVKKYNFQNDAKETIKGAKISYLVADSDSDGDNITGHLPRQASIKDLSLVAHLSEVPGIYEVNFKTVSGANNKDELKIVGFEFLNSCNLKSIFS